MQRRALLKGTFLMLICLVMITGTCTRKVDTFVFASEKEEKAQSVTLTEKQSGSFYTIYKKFIDSVAKAYMYQVVEKSQSEQMEQEALLYFVGDIMCLGGQQRAVKARNYSFDSSFCYLKDRLLEADFVCGNLETLLSKSHHTTEEQNMVNGNPNCNTRSSFAKAVMEAGFCAVTTANNHSYDWGKKGITETLSVLNELEIPQTGMITEEALPYLMAEVKGMKVAVLAYTELINPRTAHNASECAKAVHCYSYSQMEKEVKQARESGADVVIVCIHWGTENTTIVTDRQKQHAREIAAAGADVIIGSHPHCLQKAEFINGKEGKKVLCIYSMGNFVSSMIKESNKQSILLAIQIHREKDQTMQLSYAYQPLYTMGALEGNPFTVVPTNLKGASKEVKTKLIKAEQEIKKVIGDAIPLQK